MLIALHHWQGRKQWWAKALPPSLMGQHLNHGTHISPTLRVIPICRCTPPPYWSIKAFTCSLHTKMEKRGGSCMPKSTHLPLDPPCLEGHKSHPSFSCSTDSKAAMLGSSAPIRVVNMLA